MPITFPSPTRHSLRLPEYDYSLEGGYFVTIVARNREFLFVESMGEKGISLTPLGKIVREEWFRSALIRKEILLIDDEFVVMPNHIHGIVWFVGADGVRPSDIHTGTILSGAYHAPLRRKPRALGSFIAGYKASVTARAGRELNLVKIWQRNYFEHIIRNNQDYERIAAYIHDNPINWDEDEENINTSSITSSGD